MTFSFLGRKFNTTGELAWIISMIAATQFIWPLSLIALGYSFLESKQLKKEYEWVWNLYYGIFGFILLVMSLVWLINIF